jgi:hypothetical protein
MGSCSGVALTCGNVFNDCFPVLTPLSRIPLNPRAPCVAAFQAQVRLQCLSRLARANTNQVTHLISKDTKSFSELNRFNLFFMDLACGKLTIPWL